MENLGIAQGYAQGRWKKPQDAVIGIGVEGPAVTVAGAAREFLGLFQALCGTNRSGLGMVWGPVGEDFICAFR